MANAPDYPRLTSVHSTDKMDRPLTRELSLYNGVSNRSRGWKTRRTDKVMEPSSTNPSVMRWDGASKSSAVWDNLRRDPELWYRDGNCYIHLYEQGQSRRGPAFKVPFSALLEANCYPLIDRYMSREINKSHGHTHHDDRASCFSRAQRQNRIELFIPAPPQSDKRQSYNYHLATRNFFAFVFRRSVVGENLGTALISLMHSMHEFRAPDVDNIEDMMSYLDEEGYLNLESQPSHALAMLHLAEVFHLRSLYVDAFAHCCGMSDQLFLGPEYQLLSSVTRKLIRRARVEMDLRLGQSGSMLGTFLQDELSEANLGLCSGARAHLERFRTLLHGFYAARFGYYPPPSIDPRTAVFEVSVFRTMRADFEALYQYLVDESFDPSQSSPFLAQGGICTLQSVQSFDTRHKFQTLLHPLPLLPEVAHENVPSRRVPWINKQLKGSQSHRANIHAALLRATNQHKKALLKNELVRAYRRFEEDSIFNPIKADRLENLGPMDARKVRWILVYATYQALRRATEAPSEVKDAINVPYNLCISTTNLPPWKEDRPIHTLVQRQSDEIARSASTSTAGWSSLRTSSPPPQTSFEIKPDIDYFAITHRDDSVTDTRDVSARLFRNTSRKASMTRSLSRNSAVRRSLSIFAKQHTEKRPHQPRKSSYHEIVVYGYGNGLHDVMNVTWADQIPRQPSRIIAEEGSASSMSIDSSNSSAYGHSEGGSMETSDTSVLDSPTESLTYSWDSRSNSLRMRYRNDDDDDLDTPVPAPAPTPTPAPAPSPVTALKRRSRSTCPEAQRPHTLHEGKTIVARAPSRSTRVRSNSVYCGSRRTMEPAPMDIRKANTFPDEIKMPSPINPAAWEYIKAVMEVKAAASLHDDIHPEWEQYTDLGGLTEPKAARAAVIERTPRRASTMH